MVLKNIFFQLTVNDASKEYRIGFYNRSRHVCNYIERNCFKPLKFNSDSFQGIGIELRFGFEDKFMEVEPYISPNKTLVTVLTLDKEKYDNLKTDDEFRLFLFENMTKAFSKLEKTKFEIPSDEILASYEKLKDNNFENNYLFKKKTDRSRKLVAELHCQMTTENLNLILKVIVDNSECFNEVVHKETPNNMVVRQFHDLKIANDKVVILGKRDKVLKEFTLKELGVV